MSWLPSGSGFFRRFFPVLGSVALVLYVGYLAWMSLMPRKPVPDAVRKRAADAAVAEIARQIQGRRGGIRSAVLVHFANDPSDYFSDALRSVLDSTGILNLEDSSLLEKIRNKCNLRNRGCPSLAGAVRLAKGRLADGVLWGRLDRFESAGAGAVLEGEWRLAELETGKAVCGGKIETPAVSPAGEKIAKAIQDAGAGIQKNTAFVEQTARLLPWHIRFLGFVLLVLLLPILTISFVRAMVAKRSNRVNACLLGIYTAIDAIFAFFLVGGAFPSIWPVVFFLAAAALAFCYNLALMGFALKLES